MIKISANLSKLPVPKPIVGDYASPAAAGFKAFGKQLAEPFTGAAHWWSGGRAGKDYAPDSMWVDTNRRLNNLTPGGGYEAPHYNDGKLDVAAGSLGLSAAAAAAAGVATAAPQALPTAARFATSGARSRLATSGASRLGSAAKGFLSPMVNVGTGLAVGGLAADVGNGAKELKTKREEIYQNLLTRMPPERASQLADKAVYGTLWESVKEYGAHPIYYGLQHGGQNPIDQSFSTAMSGSALPHGEGILRQPAGLLSASPIGMAARGLTYATLNRLTSIGHGIPIAVDAYNKRLAAPMPAQPAPTDEQGAPTGLGAFTHNMYNALGGAPVMRAMQDSNTSSYYKRLADYYGTDLPYIMSAYSQQANRRNPKGTY